MIQEETKRKLIELNLLAAKKRKSKHTGFVHYCYEEQDVKETIPVIENACYALALFRSRLTENVLEGKLLLEKLLPFEVDGNFPLYLHEYPLCRDRSIALQLIPVFYWILQSSAPLLGKELQERLKNTIEKMDAFSAKSHAEKPFSKAFCFALELQEWSPRTLSEWNNYLIGLQMRSEVQLKEALLKAKELWNPHFFAFIGEQHYEKGEPEVTLFDLWMGEVFHAYSKRALADHPVHLRAALIQPVIMEVENSEVPLYAFKLEENSFKLWWGDEKVTHTLALFPKGRIELVKENAREVELMLHLPNEMPAEDEYEVKCFCNLHEENSIELKATTFRLGEPIEIASKGFSLSLAFNKVSGEGSFLGHISHANRPYQARNPTIFEAYDTQIALRTIKRDLACTLSLTLSINKEE